MHLRNQVAAFLVLIVKVQRLGVMRVVCVVAHSHALLMGWLFLGQAMTFSTLDECSCFFCFFLLSLCKLWIRCLDFSVKSCSATDPARPQLIFLLLCICMLIWNTNLLFWQSQQQVQLSPFSSQTKTLFIQHSNSSFKQDIHFNPSYILQDYC